MALFGFKKKKEEAKPEEGRKPEPKEGKATAPVKAAVLPVPTSLAGVLVRPRVTEKAANMTSVNVYTFDIRSDATKRQVAEAVKAMYKVTPVKVNVVNVRGKRVRMRRKRGFGKTAASRKAYVFLKKGEEIQFA